MMSKYKLNGDKIYNTEEKVLYEDISDVQKELNIQHMLKSDYRDKYENILGKYMGILENLDALEQSIMELQEKYEGTNKGNVLKEVRMLKLMKEGKMV